MNLNLAWFVGFAPVEKPEVAVATLIEGVIPQDQVQGAYCNTNCKRFTSSLLREKNTKLAFDSN